MRRQTIILITSLLLLGTAALPAVAQSPAVWTGEYFNNPNLAGSPVFVLNENTPAHDWGSLSPGFNIPADNFSARWTSVQTVNGGNYELSVNPDDGVRVLIDGVLYLNEWHPATGRPYSVVVSLSAGQHTFVVEFYEAGGVAYLQYDLRQVSGGAPGTALATVTTNELNVRNIPNPFTGAVLTRIYSGQTYPIIGRNADSSWIQLNVNGIVGWVNAGYTAATNLQSVPVTDPSTRPSNPTYATATVSAYALNVRSIPNPYTGLILARIARGATYTVVGKNADGSWLQLNVSGVVGWVNAGYVTATNLQSVPITDNSTRPTNPGAATATVTAYALNVRNLPNPYSGVILTRIRRGETYTVVGRNASSTWLQLNVNGIIGWVNAYYVAAANTQVVPITG